jgi:hypothetical protein
MQEDDSKKKQYKKFQKLDEAWRIDMMALNSHLSTRRFLIQLLTMSS